jgi:hypothetical protein
MAPTITPSGGLYLAQHRKRKDRHGYFQHMRIAALSQAAAVQTSRTLTQWRPPHSDNGK